MKNMKVVLSVMLFLFVSSGLFAQSELKVGTKAPDFTLQDAAGHSYTLSSFEGKSPVIVYFYPKAGTFGCTKEACGIRDDWNKFKKNGIKVFGVSVDGKKDLRTFIKNYHLNFPLLSDSDKVVSQKYGVLLNNGMDNRVTYVIDKKGYIANVIEVKNIEKHASQVFQLALKLK